MDRTYRTNMKWRAANPYGEILQRVRRFVSMHCKGLYTPTFPRPQMGASTQTKFVSVQYKGITHEKITVILFTGLLIFCITLSQGLFARQRKCNRGFWGLFLFLVQHFSSKKPWDLEKTKCTTKTFLLSQFIHKPNILFWICLLQSI